MKSIRILKTNLANINLTENGCVATSALYSAMGDSGFTRAFPDGILVIDAHISDIATANFTRIEGHYPSPFEDADQKKLDEYIKAESDKVIDIYKHGLDVSANTELDGRYYACMFGASNSRTSTFVLTKARNKAEVAKKKAMLMGLDGSMVVDHEGKKIRLTTKLLEEKKGENKGKVCLAQALTREAARMGASTPLSEESMEAIRQWNVVYSDKYFVENTTKYKTIGGLTGDSRTAELSDGIISGDVMAGADVAWGKGSITKEERDYYQSKLIAEDYDVNSDVLRKDQNWMRIHRIVMTMYQVRNDGSLKATMVIMPLNTHFRDADGNIIHAIIPPSARKFEDGPWPNIGTLEIMHVSKDEDYKIRQMSAALVLAGGKGKYDMWKPMLEWMENKFEACLSKDQKVASHAVQYCLRTFTPAKALEDDDMSTANASTLAASIARTAAPLYNEPVVWNTLVDKIRSVVEKTIAGGAFIPGAYPFIANDPYALPDRMAKDGVLTVVRPYHTLKSGEYCYSRKTCRAALGRSPMTNENQFKVVKLVDDIQYRDFHGILIMNAEDALWIDMSGADFDGDEVFLVLEEQRGDYPMECVTAFIDALEKNDPVVIHTEGGKKAYAVYNEENVAEFVVNSLKHGSNVGRLNNLSVMWQEVGQHAEAICDYAEANGCRFILPVNADKATEFMGMTPAMVDPRDSRILLVQSIPGDRVFGSCKVTSVRRVRALSKSCKNMTDRLDTLQSIEVDGPKTTVFVDEEEIQECSIKATSYAMLARQFMKNKVYDADGNWLDVRNATQRKQAIAVLRDMVEHPTMEKPVYNSFNVLGYITLQVSAWWDGIKDQFNNGACKGGHSILLNSLLDEDEHSMIKDAIIELKAVHDAYSIGMRDINANGNLDEDAKKLARAKLIDDTMAGIEEVRESIDASPEEMAVAAYLRTHCTLSKTSGKFGWLLAEPLLKVFSRCPERYAMMRMDNIADIHNLIGQTASIVDGKMWVNVPYGNTTLRRDIGVNNLTSAADQTVDICTTMDGTPYIFVKYNEARTAARDPHECRVPGILEGTESLFRAYGLTMRVDEDIVKMYDELHKKGRTGTWADAFKNAVATHRVFKVAMDEDYTGIILSKSAKGAWIPFAHFIPDNYNLVLLNNCMIRFIEDERTDVERKEEGRQCNFSKRGFGKQFDKAEMKVYENTGFVNGLAVEVIAE